MVARATGVQGAPRRHEQDGTVTLTVLGRPTLLMMILEDTAATSVLRQMEMVPA